MAGENTIHPNKLCKALAKYTAPICYADQCSKTCQNDGYVDGICKPVFGVIPLSICICRKECGSSKVNGLVTPHS